MVVCAAVALVFAGCASPLHRAERIARHGGLEPLVLQGTTFRHRAFARTGATDELLVVVVDGDGSPWLSGGTLVASDPTPRAPLGLRLAAETPDAVLYLGRPCYFCLQHALACSSREWTSERYSADVVASMAAAAMTYAAAHHIAKELLVGYSGGGTLVTLMAPHMPGVSGVVTIAANLDTDAWTQIHGYAPLTGLNPALQPPLPDGVREWHLVGGRDRIVPYAAARGYLERLPAGRVVRYPDFDHRCCWEEAWPAVLHRVRAELASGN